MESDQTGGDPVSETTSDVKLGSDPNSWAKFFRDTGFFQCDHALLTLFAPRDLGDQLIIGGHVALCHGIHYVNGAPRFLGTDVLIPPGAVADAVRDRIKEGIKYEMRKAGAPDILIAISSLVCKITALVNLDSGNLIQAVRELPEDGACFILSAELYRFKDLGVDSQSRELPVCSGGRSDRQIGSEEALGLVAELFRVGVRCVVAAPWPLDIQVVEHWLPAFLDSMNGGETVGKAAERARNAVRLKIDHPCAWAQMHVYGDQNYSLAEH